VGDTLRAVQPDRLPLEDPLTDEELTALALGSEPLEPLPESADDMAPPWVMGGSLPLWYMPPVARRARSRWAAPLVVGVIAAFLLIDAMGLCNTYGLLSL
jgi:hypothetical protein